MEIDCWSEVFPQYLDLKSCYDALFKKNCCPIINLLSQHSAGSEARTNEIWGPGLVGVAFCHRDTPPVVPVLWELRSFATEQLTEIQPAEFSD